MPTVYNGIGTWYYGKGNVYRNFGTCPSCGRDVVLSSYDTTLYFVVAFVPLIPLGRKRVIWQCPVCKKHRHTPLAKWLKEKQEAVRQATAKYEQNPRDSEAAQELVAVLAKYQERDVFLQAAPAIAQMHAGDAGVMKLVGAFYASLGYLAEADEALCASLRAADDRQVYEILAEVLIRQSEPEEAAPYLQHIIDDRLSDKAGQLLFLAEGYQASGEHARALEVLDKAVDVSAALKKDRRYKRLRKISQKNIATKKPIKSSALEPMVQKEATPGWGANIAKAVGPIVLAALLAVYVVVAYHAGRSRDVYLLNGLSKPYTVKVNQASHLLRPLWPLRVSLPEGPVVVEVEGGPDIPTQTFEVRTSFWTRPFVEKTFLINPDAVAPLLLEKTYYAPDNVLVPSGERALYVGDAFYEFARLDYVFEAFPEEITVNTDRKKVTKQRLCLPEPQESRPEEIARVVMDVLGAEAVEVFKKHVLYEPENGIYTHYYFSMAEPNEFIRTARPGLKARPVAVDLHRLYQQAIEWSDPNYDITTEYRSLLETEPENSTLQYLFGRVVRDTKQSLRLFEKSVSGSNPCVYGHYGLGYYKMSMGMFDETLELARRVKAAQPNNVVFRQWYLSSLKAAGRYEELMEEYEKDRQRDPKDFSLMRAQFDLLVIRGKREQAQEEFDKWVQAAGGGLTPQILAKLEDTMQANAAYLSGDLDEWGRLSDKQADGGYQYAVALSRGEAVDEQEVEKLGLNDAYVYLVIYIGEEHVGRAEAATRFLSKAVDLLARRSWEERRISKILAAEQEPDPEQVCALPMEPKTKAIALTAMGVKFPEHRPTYFELARKLNFDRHFPHLFLKSVLEEESRPAAAATADR